MAIFCNIINASIVSFRQFKVSLLNKSKYKCPKKLIKLTPSFCV